MTTIYVTHDQVEAMTMGTRIAVMRKGVLQQQGPPQTLYDEPDNLFVATFIGSPAMNLLRGTHRARRRRRFGARSGTSGCPTAASSATRARPRGYGAARSRVGIRPEHLGGIPRRRRACRACAARSLSSRCSAPNGWSTSSSTRSRS